MTIIMKQQLSAARSRRADEFFFLQHRAVELKLLGDCAPRFQGERVRDINVAALRDPWAAGPR